MHAHKDNGDHSKGTMTQTGALLEGTLSSMTKQPRVLRTFLGCRYRRGAAVCPRLNVSGMLRACFRNVLAMF